MLRGYRNLHPLSPLKTLFHGKFVLRNEYLLESVQVVLFRIGAKTVFSRELSAQPAPIIPVFRNDLSIFLAWILHPRQCLHQLGAGQKRQKNFALSKDSNPVRGSLSVAVGDAASPTTPYGVAYREQQYSGNMLKMNLLRIFETTRGHPFFSTEMHSLRGYAPLLPMPPLTRCCPSTRCEGRRRSG